MTCKAIQEKFSASSLNTNDCFVLVNPDQVTVWFGKGSTGDEREMAKVAKLVIFYQSVDHLLLRPLP